MNPVDGSSSTAVPVDCKSSSCNVRPTRRVVGKCASKYIYLRLYTSRTDLHVAIDRTNPLQLCWTQMVHGDDPWHRLLPEERQRGTESRRKGGEGGEAKGKSIDQRSADCSLGSIRKFCPKGTTDHHPPMITTAGS
jgi:hypothetical protein